MTSDKCFGWSKLNRARYFHKLAQSESQHSNDSFANNQVFAVKALESIINLFKLANGREDFNKQNRKYSSLSPKPTYYFGHSNNKKDHNNQMKDIGFRECKLRKKNLLLSEKASPMQLIKQIKDSRKPPNSARFTLIKELETAVRRKAKVIAKTINNSKQTINSRKTSTLIKRSNNTSKKNSPLKLDMKNTFEARNTMSLMKNLKIPQGSYRTLLTPDPFITKRNYKLNNTLKNNLQNCLRNIKENSIKKVESRFDSFIIKRTDKSIGKTVSDGIRVKQNKVRKSISPIATRSRKVTGNINELKHQLDKLTYKI